MKRLPCKMIIFIVIILNSIYSSEEIVTGKNYSSIPYIFDMDNFDTCMLLQEEALYCLVDYQLRPIDDENPSEYWNIIKELSSNPRNYRHDLLRHGICVPKSCPNIDSKLTDDDDVFRKQIGDCIDLKITSKGLTGTIKNIHCETTDPYPIDIYDIIVGLILGGYVVFVIFSSLYEGIARYKTPEEYQNFLKTPLGNIAWHVSIPSNWYRLTTVNKSSNSQTFDAIQGIRFYNMFCVILSHTAFAFFLGPIINTKFSETFDDKFASLFMLSGAYCVSTFFIITNFLFAYNIFVIYDGKKEIPVSYFVNGFMNRMLRILPPLIVVVAIHSTWIMHYGRGPHWYRIIGEETVNCRRNGWTNLLFINNYINVEDMCLGQTWYLNVDTQFFIYASIIMYVIWKFPKRIWIILGSIQIFQILVTGSTIYFGNIDAAIFPTPELLYDSSLLHTKTFQVLMYSPFSNVPGMISGLGWGYVCYKYRNQKVFTRKWHTACWWFATFGICLGVIIIPGLIIRSPTYQHDKLWAAIHVSLGRPLFTFGMGAVIFGTFQGIGWMAKWTLEWYPTYILGRITYCAYLIHVIPTKINTALSRTPSYVTDHTVIVGSISNLVISYLLGLVLVLFVEMPCSKLHKTLFQKESQNKEDANTSVTAADSSKNK